MAKRTKDLTRVGRRVRAQRRKTTSPLWRRKALAVWSKIVRRGGRCEVCGRPGDEVQLQGHHLIPKEKVSWLQFAPANGVCLCSMCHKGGRFAVHCSPFFFVNWLKEHKPQQYEWVMAHLHEPPRPPPDFKRAYDKLVQIAAGYGLEV